MKKLKSNFIVFFAIVTLLINGCASTKTLDTAPEATRKGYVEFSMPEPNVTSWMKIREVRNGKVLRLGAVRPHGFQNPNLPLKLRVAVTPGSHTFELDAAQYLMPKAPAGKFELTVLENMVTPVEIRTSMTSPNTMQITSTALTPYPLENEKPK